MKRQPIQAIVRRPSAHVIGLEQRRRIRTSAIPCVIGEDLITYPEKLGRYCSGELDRRADDLIVFAGVVAYADRMVKRATASSWVRDIHITVPVLDVDFWRTPRIEGAARELLNLLTGDVWELSFVGRRSPLTVANQGPLALKSSQPSVVMPYSDGMDSFAVARLLNHEEPDTTLIMVTTGRRRDADEDVRKGTPTSQRFRFAVPFRVSSKRARESSYRSRALIYGTMGAIAAKLSGSKRVVVAESGQGALGPWLAPVGNEAIDLRMHPIYTSAFARFVYDVLDAEVKFQHPRLWSTKGETLRALVAAQSANGWEVTRSCAGDQRHMSLQGALAQCGICAACLLRRVSIREAKLDESADLYMWSDLTAPSLREAAHEGAKQATENDVDQAVCGALALQQLSGAGEDLSAKAWELAGALGTPSDRQLIEQKLRRLIDAHRQEWHRFVDAQGPRSFLAAWTRAGS